MRRTLTYFFTPAFILILLLFSSFTVISCRSAEQVSVPAKTFDSDVIQLVNSISVSEKIGQVFLMNFRFWKQSETNNEEIVNEVYHTETVKIPVAGVHKINPTIEKMIKKYHIGNVIICTENLKNTDEAVKFIYDLQNLAVKNNGIPMLTGVDQEGGRVTRVKQSVKFPPARTIGLKGDTDLAFTEGEYLAEQISAFGMNLDFAPDCDVDSNPKNRVIGDRSYSTDAETAGKFSLAVHKGLKNKNVIACAKHFPGHGDTAIDSHIGLPKIKKSKSRWLKCEAVPFKMNIDNGIPMIMTAHIQYPALDKSKIKSDKTDKVITRPATLSKKILTDILRGELGFEGVICTDAMDMHAISKNFTESRAVIEALNAGADLICHPLEVISVDDIPRVEKMYCDIEKAVEDGTLPMERLDNAVMRIVQLKKDYKILYRKFSAPDKKDFENTKKILTQKKYQDFADRFKD